MALTPTSVYRGFPPSENYNPDKDDIIALLTAIQTIASGGAFTAVDVTLADLANGTTSGDLGLVLSEASDGGVYRWNGSAWVLIGALPFVVGGEVYAQLAKAWAESATSPDGEAGSKSAKTWAAEAETAATALDMVAYMQTANFVGVAGQTDYTLVNTPELASQVLLWRGGKLQKAGEHYSIAVVSGAPVLRLAEAPDFSGETFSYLTLQRGMIPPETVFTFDTRAELVTHVALNGVLVGRYYLADGLHYFAPDGGSSAIADLSGLVESGTPLAEHHGAVGDGTANDAAAITTYLARCTTLSVDPTWQGKKTYRADSNIPSLLSYNHRGAAQITDGTNTIRLGDEWTSGTNTVYCSPSGLATNDGYSAARPVDLTNGFNYLSKQVARLPALYWVFQFAAGTYPNGASRRFETFPATLTPVLFQGPDVSGGVPTAIFDGWTVNVFRKIFGGGAGQNLKFKDLKAINNTAPFIFLHNDLTVETENLHGEDFTGSSFAELRSCKVKARGGRVESGTGGYILQDVYGDAGFDSGVENIIFNGIVNSGLASCVNVSRGSICYVAGNSFGETAACDIHISQSRISRVRSRGNTFAAFNTAAIVQDGLSILNDDLAAPDTFTGGAFGTPSLISSPGNIVTRYHNGKNMQGHLQYNGAAVTLTGTTRTDMGITVLAPFRMPGYWLRSPTARGVVTYFFSCPVAETITLELAGEAAGAGQVLDAITLTPSSATTALVMFEINGAPPGGDQGFAFAESIPNAGTRRHAVGLTPNLNQAAFSNASGTAMRFRLYVTRSDGTGDLSCSYMRSEVCF